MRGSSCCSAAVAASLALGGCGARRPAAQVPVRLPPVIDDVSQVPYVSEFFLRAASWDLIARRSLAFYDRLRAGQP